MAAENGEAVPRADCTIEDPHIPPWMRRDFAWTYFGTEGGFAFRLHRKSKICWVGYERLKSKCSALYRKRRA